LIALAIIIFNSYIVKSPKSKIILTKQKRLFLSNTHISATFYRKCITVIVTILGIVINSYFAYSPSEQNYIAEFRDTEHVYSIATDTPAKTVSKIKDILFYRYDENIYGGQSYIINSSVLNKQNGTSYYFSLLNGNVSQFRDEINIDDTSGMDFRYGGLDNRTISDILLNIKYFVVKSNLEKYLPYGFDQKILSYKTETGVLYDVYKTKYTLPLGYTYSYYIPREEYNKFSAIQKQQLMLQSAVIDSNVSTVPL
jgi:hypothetical protein